MYGCLIDSASSSLLKSAKFSTRFLNTQIKEQNRYKLVVLDVIVSNSELYIDILILLSRFEAVLSDNLKIKDES